MLLPYTVDVPMQRVPVANWVLISATCMISFAVWTGARVGRQPPPTLDDPEEERFRRIEQELDDRRAPALSLQPDHFSFFQLFSYVLVHADAVHLAGNMIFLFVFGNAINAKLGHAPFLVFYFLLGALAGLPEVLLQSQHLPIVGASGAIMGIVGVFLVLYPRNEVSVLYWVGFARGGSFEMASGWLIASYMAWDLVGTLFLRNSGIGYIAHLAGALGGIALAGGLILTRLVRSSPGEENLFEALGPQSASEDGPGRRERKKKKRARLPSSQVDGELSEPQGPRKRRKKDTQQSPENWG
jgi:membrane associated rhomboid family serine protease